MRNRTGLPVLPAGRAVEAAFRLPTPVAKGVRRTGLGVGGEDSGVAVTPPAQLWALLRSPFAMGLNGPFVFFLFRFN